MTFNSKNTPLTHTEVKRVQAWIKPGLFVQEVPELLVTAGYGHVKQNSEFC